MEAIRVSLELCDTRCRERHMLTRARAARASQIHQIAYAASRDVGITVSNSASNSGDWPGV